MSQSLSASQTSNLSTLKEFGAYLWGGQEDFSLRLRIISACLLLFLAKGTILLVPVSFKLLVDHLVPSATSWVLILIVAYGGCRLMTQVFSEVQNALFAKVGQRAVRMIAYKVFVHLHALSLEFHLARKTGALSRAIERGTKSIENLLYFGLFNIIPSCLEILFVCALLWILYDQWFALVTFLTMACYVVTTIKVINWRVQFLQNMNQSEDTANTRAIDSLLNYETIQYFNNVNLEISRFDGALQRYEQAAVKSRLSLAVLNISQGVVISLGLIIIMAMAASKVKQGTLTMGDFVLVNTCLLQLYLPLSFLGHAYREIKQALINMAELFGLLKVQTTVKTSPSAPPLKLKKGEVEFKDVSFSYIPERPILKNVSFTVPAGKTVAIVGPSGSGKSTLVRLLFRFYEVTSGQILIDGQEIHTVSLDSLRQAIGIVPQDTVLFNDTLFYNIAYGRPSATEEEVIHATKLARLHDFILTLPHGYQTQVGERGLKLSGGEKQRVAIARTILKNPSLYVFDEATSALDTRTEKTIQESLFKLSRKKTTLIIAHRLSTVTQADMIIVLDKGQIAEAGPHTALLEKEGLYAKLWHQQLEEETGDHSERIL